MLQAKTTYGKLVTLAFKTSADRVHLQKHTPFFCPVCHEPVIAKVGPQIVPHFAHRPQSHCPSQEGGEGIYHEKGKLLLYQWLMHQYLDVQLEAYLPAINQRPDILLKLKHKTVAIEYQCARIRQEQIIKRNEGYYSQGIVPIWILGANRFNRRGRNAAKIDRFQRHFIHQFSSNFPLTLYYFCPDTLHVILFQDFYFLTKQQAAGQLQINKLPAMIVTDLFKASWFKPEHLWHIWKRAKRSFRLKPPGHTYGRERAWQQWLYVNRLHRETLPSVVYLPVSAQFRMKSPLWDWQSRLCLEIITPLKKGESFSLQHCLYVLRQHFSNSKSNPLVKPTFNPIYQYLQVLESVHIIREVSPAIFVKQQDITSYSHIETALNGDNVFLDQLLKRYPGMNQV